MMDPNQINNNGTVKTWFWILLMLGMILITGLYAFFIVSDRGQPDWDYRSVKDVPSQSSHANYELLPDPQHIKGRKGE